MIFVNIIIKMWHKKVEILALTSFIFIFSNLADFNSWTGPEYDENGIVLATELTPRDSITTDKEMAVYASGVCDTSLECKIIDIANYAYWGGFRGKNLNEAIAVALAESAGDPKAININRNKSRDIGLWQINTNAHKWAKEKNLYDPYYNAHAAYKVFKSSGWKAWYAHTPRNGKYGSNPRYIYYKKIVDRYMKELTFNPYLDKK
jgi:hypothetical protein